MDDNLHVIQFISIPVVENASSESVSSMLRKPVDTTCFVAPVVNGSAASLTPFMRERHGNSDGSFVL
ncbi:hypothetical protein PHMEG_00031067 [Phytophthora megakarya]|uniref:Uncharacterized protein n=1 Tax=Phytophthora megakarya TaxID=4795 RepID=A0A225UZJ6_9STRA|nr:hypothetical protein PHMEG_00031067 [Phytophthora megakarya]